MFYPAPKETKTLMSQINTQITTFNKENMRCLRERVILALKPLEAEFGVTFQPGNGSFTDSNFSFKLSCSLRDLDGNAVTKEADDFRFFAKQIGFAPEDLGRKFRHF